MKKLTILGVLLLSVTILISCGEANLQDLDKDIDNEEDAVEALIIIANAELSLMEKAMVSLQELSDMQDRYDDIQEAYEEVDEMIDDEEWDDEDLEDADNYDEYEDLYEDLEKKGEDLSELWEEANELINGAY
jgi:DNA repair ATPase RecN